jgi:hypothetical protein
MKKYAYRPLTGYDKSVWEVVYHNGMKWKRVRTFIGWYDAKLYCDKMNSNVL